LVFEFKSKILNKFSISGFDFYKKIAYTDVNLQQGSLLFFTSAYNTSILSLNQ